MTEIWRPITLYPKYEVSTYGNVRRPAGTGSDGRRLKGSPLNPAWGGGPKRLYRIVGLSDGVRGQKQFKVSWLVLLTFVGIPPLPGMDARHLDDNQSNDRLENLAWGTRKQNMADAIWNGRAALGERHGCSKITRTQAEAIRNAPTRKARLELAALTGISRRQAGRIASGKNWKRWPTASDAKGGAA